MKRRAIAEGLSALELPLEIHPEGVNRLERFAELLETEAIPRGFLGPAESARIRSRHILEGAALFRHMPGLGPMIDVGSGAGLPGLVIACLGGEVTLVEPIAKRVAFLRRVVHDLGLTVDIVRGRAEDVAHGALRESAAYVTARGLAAVPVALELTVPFVRVGGRVLLMVGEVGVRRVPDIEADVRTSPVDGEADSGPTLAGDPGAPLRDGRRPEPRAGHQERVEHFDEVADELGAGRPEVARFELPGAIEGRWVMIVPKVRPTPDRYPRPAGLRQRRPLGLV